MYILQNKIVFKLKIMITILMNEANQSLLDIVLFGVESVFSFFEEAGKTTPATPTTPDEMLKHLAGALGEKFGLENSEKICKPFYWGLVYIGNTPQNSHPFYLKPDLVKDKGSMVSVNYVVKRDGMDLANSEFIDDCRDRIIEEYGETLEARMKRER